MFIKLIGFPDSIFARAAGGIRGRIQAGNPTVITVVYRKTISEYMYHILNFGILLSAELTQFGVTQRCGSLNSSNLSSVPNRTS